ncbi:MAG TPA: fatty acyl-AMP ligase [Candidatus Angelobacter sp.]|jgi:acyl-CoA synthetase (AMP-forming)/AMP-acid ligase II|nr:fatty acyl-AMP ligase [Candidatus Angelobacter sp.]
MPERLQQALAAAQDFPSHKEWSSFVALLRHRASTQGQQTGYLFLRDNDPEKDLDLLSYAQLDQKARAIASVLQATGEPGQRVLLLHQPGLHFVTAFYGCLYAGAIAVTTYPVHRGRLKQALPKICSLLKDSECGTVLTTEEMAASFAEAWEEVIDERCPLVIASDTLRASGAEKWHAPAVGRDSVAFLQYTSGSTSSPRGVAVTHGNMLHNSELIARGFESDSRSMGISWLPPYHDMGLIGGVVKPLFVGFPVVILSPYTFLQQPFRWLQTITKVRATVTGGPNFAYDLCVRKVTPEQRSKLDLSSWKIAFNGAEPIHPETMERFSALFSSCGFNPKAFYPCYGLAESTLYVTGGKALAGPKYIHVNRSELEQGKAVAAKPNDGDTKMLVGCGHAAAEQKVVIVDPQTQRKCPDGSVGEIWVSSLSVAAGYWNRPQESAKVFCARLADDGKGPFLRTGDLGFLQKGELFVTGRIKDLIIINGRNLYPQDVEITAQASHPALQPFGGAAFCVEHESQERLVIAQEVQREFLRADSAEMMAAIRQAIVRDYDVQAYAVALLKPGQVPRTSSGKVRRSLCKASLMAGELETVDLHPNSENTFWSHDAGN